MKPSRKQIWAWKNFKALPKPSTLKRISDENVKEEAALCAIQQYVPFVKDKNKLLKVIK
ncbi:MAG: hypothetical protein ABGX26_02630 [Nautiliaceae bacterium]